MRIVQSNNAAIILTRERFMLKSRNEEEIVYSAKVATRIGAITSLIVLGSLMVYVHMQVLRFFGLILCLCIIISKYFWAFSIFRRWRHAWNPIETIAMDRINHAVTLTKVTKRDLSRIWRLTWRKFCMFRFYKYLDSGYLSQVRQAIQPFCCKKT